MVRTITVDDVKEWTNLVAQLSPKANKNLDFDDVALLFDLICGNTKRIIVYELDGKIIGTVSILFEQKVNNGVNNKYATFAAHIEEVVVDKEHRDKGIGKILMDEAVKLAEASGAYKIVLDCSEENVEFYEKCGFHRHEVCMRRDIK